MDPFGLAMVALKEWFEKQMGYVSDTYGGEGSLYWDTDARIAYVSMSGNGYEGYAEFAPGVAGSYIDPTNNRLYVEEALLWAVFGRIIDPPLQTDWVFNTALFIGSAGVAYTGLSAVGLVGAEVTAGTATAAVTATTMSPALQNKLAHIFGNVGHNFAGLLNSFNGSQVNAYNAIYNAAQRAVQAQNLTGTFHSVNNPIVVYVGGKVVDGILYIGTAYIK